MNWLVEEFKATQSHERKLQILTLSPLSINRTVQIFNTTTYMVNKSRKLRKDFGILPEIPKVSKGRVITEDMRREVENFYNSDDVSRVCPGKSDFLSIKDKNGQKQHVQKRLILGNLKEIYEQYKNEFQHSPKVGFSTFASLRPKYCIIAGANGTHSICVCVYHQNPKLMISAIGCKDINIKILMEKCVCNMNNKQCMLQQCRKCPGINGISNFLQLMLESDCRDIINFSQWVQTDRSTLEILSLSIDEFIGKLSGQIRKLTKHHFIAKCQSNYIKDLKNNIQESEGIIIGDFSENYSFVVQDASQAFHWTRNQATIHPFILYYKENTNLCHNTFCFISNCLEHKTTLVYVFQKALMTEINKLFPNIRKIHYFTDGSVAQYKNRYNFINLCYHDKDFYGIIAEWNFFATSHGKNVCDGIGGMVKRAATKASLQRTTEHHILTAKDLYTYSESNFPSIKFFYITTEEFQKEELFLKHRFKEPKTIKGTQGFHKVIPKNINRLLAYEISDSDIYKEFKYQTDGGWEIINDCCKFNVDNKPTDVESINGKYVACIYESKIWLGFVELCSLEYQDVKIKFMYNLSQNVYYFPDVEDTCWVQLENIIYVMSQPNITSKRKIEYSFDRKELLRAHQL